MNNKEFIAALSLRSNTKNSVTQQLVDTLMSAMAEHFQEGDAVQLPNFGAFEVKKKMERIMVNPSSGQRMLVPPKLVLAFKPNVTWKDRIKNGGND